MPHTGHWPEPQAYRREQRALQTVDGPTATVSQPLIRSPHAAALRIRHRRPAKPTRHSRDGGEGALPAGIPAAALSSGWAQRLRCPAKRPVLLLSLPPRPASGPCLRHGTGSPFSRAEKHDDGDACWARVPQPPWRWPGPSSLRVEREGGHVHITLIMVDVIVLFHY